MALSQAAAQAAHEAGLLIDGVRLDRTATAERIIQYLEEHDESLGGQSSASNAPTLDQICTAVFRSLEPELYDTVTQLCSLSATGTVQHRLNGRNVMLCGSRVTRAFTMDGSAIPAHRNFTVRFVSRDPRVVVETLIEPKTRAFGRAAQRYQDLMSLTEKRVPELGEYLERQRFLASRQAQHTLGAGLQQQNSSLFDQSREADADSQRGERTAGGQPHEEIR
jgi:hypothetical protein